MPEPPSSRTPPRAPFAAGAALNLQRKVGNRAFARLVHPPEPKPETPPGSAAQPSALPRRWIVVLLVGIAAAAAAVYFAFRFASR